MDNASFACRGRDEGDGQDGQPPLRRQQSAIVPRRVVAKVTTKRRAVRTGLLARIFFPHYVDTTPATGSGPQLSSKPGRQVSSLTKRPSRLVRRSPGAVTPRPGDVVELEPADEARLAAEESRRSGQFVPPPCDEDGVPLEDLEEGEEQAPLTMSQKVAAFIQSRTVQTIFLVLLVFDVLLVIAEILILTFASIHTEVPRPHAGATPAPSPLAASSTPVGGYAIPAQCANATLVKRKAPSSYHGEAKEFLFVEPEGCPIGVHLALSHSLHTAEVALAWCSRLILWAFGVELLVLLGALRLEFLKNPMYDLDFIVIAVAITLDAVIWARHAHEEPAIGLILLLRCWRFARILHGVGLSVHEVDEIEFHEHEEEHHRLFHSPTNVAMDATQTSFAMHPDGHEKSPVVPAATATEEAQAKRKAHEPIDGAS